MLCFDNRSYCCSMKLSLGSILKNNINCCRYWKILCVIVAHRRFSPLTDWITTWFEVPIRYISWLRVAYGSPDHIRSWFNKKGSTTTTLLVPTVFTPNSIEHHDCLWPACWLERERWDGWEGLAQYAQPGPAPPGAWPARCARSYQCPGSRAPCLRSQNVY